MNVRTMLERKAGGVETTGPATDVSSAVRRMSQMGIGSLVVCDRRGRVQGVIDERDVLQAMARCGRAVHDLPVSEVMKRKLITCTLDQDVKQVMSIMTRERVRHVVVVDADELIGVVSIGDVVKHRIDEAELEVNVLRDYARARGAQQPWSAGRVR